MWGIIPAARNGTRIQPLAFSKELLPVGSRRDGQREQPRVGSEYLVERMIRGGVGKICFVISPGKGDILRYYGDSFAGARIAYVVQTQAAERCDAVLMDEACRVREMQVKRADMFPVECVVRGSSMSRHADWCFAFPTTAGFSMPTGLSCCFAFATTGASSTPIAVS